MKKTKVARLPGKKGLKQGDKGKNVVLLQKLLIDLGYLQQAEKFDPDQSDPGHSVAIIDTLGEFDQATAQALSAFQRAHALDDSQVLDKATLSLFDDIACRSAALAIGETTKRIYTYEILNTHPDLPGNDLPRAIEQAFAIWSLHTPLAFLPVPIDTTPDITFRFESISSLGNALIEFDEDTPWRLTPTGRASSYDFVGVAVHEIGHKLGLSHTVPPVSGSLMNTTRNNSDYHRFLHPLNINEIGEIHGSQTIRDITIIHGTSVTPESPGQLDLFRPMGPLTRAVGIRGLSSSWFHFAVPSPLVSNNATARLHAVRLKVRTFADSQVTRVHIWDGNSFLGQHILYLRGGVSENVPRLWDVRLGVARKPRITNGGVGISIDAGFGQGTAVERRIDFISAGAEFIDPNLTNGQVLQGDFF